MHIETALDQPQTSPPAAREQRIEIAYADLNALLAALEHERIAALAYAYWEQRGCPHGSPDEDWLRAQRDIRESAK